MFVFVVCVFVFVVCCLCLLCVVRFGAIRYHGGSVFVRCRSHGEARIVGGNRVCHQETYCVLLVARCSSYCCSLVIAVRFPILIAIDEYNSFFGGSGFINPVSTKFKPEQLPASKLAIAHTFSTLKNTTMVCVCARLSKQNSVANRLPLASSGARHNGCHNFVQSK
jgi:hypothetical protein